MAEETKGTAAELRDAIVKTRNALKKTEQKVEEKTGTVLRAGVTWGFGGLAGITHEAMGKDDKVFGQKILRVGGVHIGLLAGFAGLGAELLEAGGKNSEWLGAAANGVGAQAAGDYGRVFVRNVKSARKERSSERAAAEKAAADKAAADKAAADKSEADKSAEKKAA